MNGKIFANAQIYLEYIILQIIYNEKDIEYNEVEFSSNVYDYKG